MNDSNIETVTIDKLVHGGQGLGVLPDGRKVFAWNALPGETVRVALGRKKKSFAEGIAVEVVSVSPERIEPEDSTYLATSPWQIMTVDCENYWKHAIVRETFEREKVTLPDEISVTTLEPFGYRNKMEYSFWGDEEHGLCLALYNRGSHQKMMVEGAAISMPAIDRAARRVRDHLRVLGVRAGDLKSLIVRAEQSGSVVASLYAKTKDKLELAALLEGDDGLKGVRLYYSDPKSPAAVPTKLLVECGNTTMHDTLLEVPFEYNADAFFQVNIPIYEIVLQKIRSVTEGMPKIVDMYSGVGTIGLLCDAAEVVLVELDAENARAAECNLAASGKHGEVVQASTEKALDYITDIPIIFDPPRAGLHHKVVERVLEALPEKIVYLSCNPSTQARDMAALSAAYTITDAHIYNFFPRTPHIESLLILERSARIEP